jgi:glycerophosphoryl diester phosphodiesterase
MDRAHAAGKKVFAYTVNTKAIAKRLKKLQIDGIVTDYPDIMKNEP